MIISIDGPAGSGKSTVASLLAEKLGFIHFNSGSLFRAITAYLLENNFNFAIIEESYPKLELQLDIKIINNSQHIFVNNIDYTSELRNNNVSIHAPLISINKYIRNIIDKKQKQFAKSNNVVIDGRDIGSHVFPKAEFKFYLDCNIKERAKRRFNEEKLKNSKITLKQIKNELSERDFFDKTRKIAPLVIPKNAIVVDSTKLTIDEVIDKMLNHIKETIRN